MLRKSQMWFETFFLLNWTSKWWQPLETIEWYYYFSFSEKNIRVQRLEVKQQSLTLWEIYRQKLLLCSNHPRYIFNFPGQTITHLSPVQGRNIISAILTHDLTLTLTFAVGLILSYCTWCNQINSAAHMGSLENSGKNQPCGLSQGNAERIQKNWHNQCYSWDSLQYRFFTYNSS